MSDYCIRKAWVIGGETLPVFVPKKLRLVMSQSLIINSPYSCPDRHWVPGTDGEPLTRKDGRRPAGYTIADPTAKPYHDRGIFVELPIVNQIRQRVDQWRMSGYEGITGITKVLLEHWLDNDQREFPFFFCQIEAIETLIWLIESPESEKSGIEIKSDGGEFLRLCSKLATGTGKTTVMAMLIAWQSINRSTYPIDRRFSQNFFVVAPNLTVRERLAVLVPSNQPNYYDEFGIVPPSLRQKFLQANVLVRNWHALNWETENTIEKKKGVDKRGVKSDEAYTREVLGDIAHAKNIVVINDEAHHAWRVPAGSRIKGVRKEEIDEATKWVGGLDRIHKTRGILSCFDFSATPFAPNGRKTSEEALFDWIISDFGLNDAIESGLVKTPRVVIRDDALSNAKTYKSRLYHIYSDNEVKDDLNRKAKPHDLLPDFIVNAYTLLGYDWNKTKDLWSDRETPPVMITVANRTETAARINHAFINNNIPGVDSLSDPDGILHIDSKVLKEAEDESMESSSAKKQGATALREKVNTVGQMGKPGAKVQNVISVGMLSEGWDARTVTQIMGLRAFSSQLLCEQVIGRGLRRSSYEVNETTGMFDPEYVNVFGVPFSFLPHVEESGNPPAVSEKITVQPVKEKKQFAIKWPNVVRVNRTLESKLTIGSWEKVLPLTIDSAQTVQLVELAPTVDNQPDVSKISDIDLNELGAKNRIQTTIFRTAKAVFEEESLGWKGSQAILMAQLVQLAEQFLNSEKIKVIPELYNQDRWKRQLVISLNMSRVVRHFLNMIQEENTQKAELVLDENYPIRSTEDMRPWRTGKPFEATNKSHINYCVFDSAWEESAAIELDRNDVVASWVKNDHLGFEVLYTYQGVVRKYRPDYLVYLKSDKTLVLEIKGQQEDQDNAKHSYMKQWIKAVNGDGRFGFWQFTISRSPSDLKDILVQANGESP